MVESPSEYVSWERAKSVWTITINRPDAKNALTSSMYEALKTGIRLGSALPDVGVIVIRGVNDSFAVGGDLDGLLELVSAGPADFRTKFEMSYHDPLPWSAALTSTKPLMAAIDGYCVAGGLLLASCCDIAIATPRSKFGIPEARVGIADVSTVELLTPSIGLMRTRYLALTGAMIDASTAEMWGLITMCVDDLDSALQSVIADLSLTSPTSQRAFKSMFRSLIGPMESDVLMDVALTGDGKEGLLAFKEKRPPVWPSRRATPGSSHS